MFFSILRLCDLVFDPMCSIFKLDQVIIISTYLTNFLDIWFKTVVSIVLARVFHIWTVWPSFWPQMTNIRTWPRNKLNNLLINFQDFWIKTVASRVLARFSHSDIVFDPRWSIFKLDLEIIKTTFLATSQDCWIKTIVSRVLTMFFFYFKPL
jgi:hypothetical protein